MSTPEVQVSWQDYISVAFRRKIFFLVPFVASIIIGLLVMLLSPRFYEAQALIMVQNEKLINPLIQGLAMPTPVAARLNTLREEILSWSNLTRLITTHKLDQQIPKNDPVAFERLVVRLREDIQVKMKGGSLIQVSYQGMSPQKVQELVNSLTDIVIQRDSAIQEQEASTAVGFIEAELAVYRKKLEESEKRLRQFKELHMTQMPIVTALHKSLKDLEVDLAGLMIDNTEEHPRVRDVRRQIAEVRRQRDDEIRRLVAKGVLENKDPELYEELLDQLATEKGQSTDASVQRAQEAVNAVVQGLEAPEVGMPTRSMAINPQGGTIEFSDAAAGSLALAPRQQQELARLSRDYNVDESIYKGLLEKLERAKITGRLGSDEQGGKFIVLERARYPLRPVKPNPVQVFLIAIFVGAALGVAAVLMAEYLDQAVQTTEEVAELLTLPVLGAISTIVTQQDIEDQKRRREKWWSARDHADRVKSRVVNPVWSRVDKALVKWGL